eukprot:CAMPEP_0167785830 /NCGR_PEP_ID=MMETSP0111_2-20121227/8442_1 /TAXON_ID=91324 /ORGANISM="Lotharella globosa, Strain CCCM811" /LENGTH=956 /DNA_ID=CAMNT_0007677119 /DNA_START=95 /DNA_END=2965 /DNA_ORIENTATION=+
MTSKDSVEKKAPADKTAKSKKGKGDKSKDTVVSNQPQVGCGVVKNVTSGGTVVIYGQATQGNAIPPEKTITLSGVNVPKMQRRTQRDDDKEKDEPYAFHAREFLRKLLIGKKVSFTTNHTNANGREYGNLTFDNISVADQVVSAGFGVVKTATNKEGKMHADREALYGLQVQAEKAGRGRHAKGVDPSHAVRDVNYDPDTFHFYMENKGKAVPVIVDYVRSGSTVSVEVPRPNMKHLVFNVTLCGIVCPRTVPLKRKGQKKEEKVNPIGVVAQHYVAKRLLKRDMEFVTLGIDKSGNIYGRLQFAAHPERDITKLLLKNGYGRYLPWTGALIDPKLSAEYRACEAAAAAAKVGLWENPKAQRATANTSQPALMKVVMVNSGDSLTIQDAKGKDIRVNLASVRTPRMGRRETPSEPLAFEAKEWLRKKIVGKRVSVRFEYKRGTGNTQSDFVSIEQGRQNINEQLCSLGFATAVQHMMEGPRAYNYVKLVEADKKAQIGKRGLHSKPPPTVHKYTDLTEIARSKKDTKKKDAEEGDAPAPRRQRGEADVERAKTFLPQLGTSQHRGHVEYVISGSKLKVYLASKKLMCNVVLAGVQVPRTAGRRSGSQGDKYGEEASTFVKNLCLQQNVIVEMSPGENAVDRRGNFVAYVWVDGPSKVSVAAALLRKGLAKIFVRSAEAGGYLDVLRKAENVAKKDRIKVWETFDEEMKKRKAEKDKRAEAEKKSKYQKIRVTEIVDGTSFYAQLEEDKNLTAIEEALAKVDGTKPEDFEPEFGMVCACKYEDSWCRVQINDVDETEMCCDVVFVDYGNKDTLQWADVVPIDEELSRKPPCALKYRLAGILPPPEGLGWTDPAFQRLGELTYDKVFNAEVLLRDNQGTHVTLSSPDKKEGEKEEAVQATLLKEGLARLTKRPAYEVKFLNRQFRDYQQEGVKARAGIWEYGEVSDEEEEEDNRRRRK